MMIFISRWDADGLVVFAPGFGTGDFVPFLALGFQRGSVLNIGGEREVCAG